MSPLHSTMFYIFLLVSINPSQSINTWTNFTGLHGEDIWNSTSDFIPQQSESFGSIRIGQIMTVEFDFVFNGRSNNPRPYYEENFFRIGHAGTGGGCDKACRYPSMWLKSSMANTSKLDISVTSGSQSDFSHYIELYPDLPIGVSMHIKITMDYKVITLNITGGGYEDYTESWERYDIRKDHLGTRVPVWWMSDKPSGSDYNVGDGTFSDITIVSKIFTFAPTNAPTSLTVSPTSAPSNAPTKPPSHAPSDSTDNPTQAPTVAPTEDPTNAPSDAPTKQPTPAPTVDPTSAPSLPPSDTPSQHPSVAPSQDPTHAPSKSPTDVPSDSPSISPTSSPSLDPTGSPSLDPTDSPTDDPSSAPSDAPTAYPTGDPTTAPSTAPSDIPSTAPSTPPTSYPTSNPTLEPTTSVPTTTKPTPVIPTTANPSIAPTTTIPTTAEPTFSPSNAPTSYPTDTPSLNPTVSPSQTPSVSPSDAPSSDPTQSPTTKPTDIPTTAEPTIKHPTKHPTSDPTALPTDDPTEDPTIDPTTQPTHDPSVTPTTAEPITPPSEDPTTESPTTDPTDHPTRFPTDSPTDNPTEIPTKVPTSQSDASPTTIIKETEDCDNTEEGCGKEGDTNSTNPYTYAFIGAIVVVAIFLMILALCCYWKFKPSKEKADFSFNITGQSIAIPKIPHKMAIPMKQRSPHTPLTPMTPLKTPVKDESDTDDDEEEEETFNESDEDVLGGAYGGHILGGVENKKSGLPPPQETEEAVYPVDGSLERMMDERIITTGAEMGLLGSYPSDRGLTGLSNVNSIQTSTDYPETVTQTEDYTQTDYDEATQTQDYEETETQTQAQTQDETYEQLTMDEKYDDEVDDHVQHHGHKIRHKANRQYENTYTDEQDDDDDEDEHRYELNKRYVRQRYPVDGDQEYLRNSMEEEELRRRVQMERKEQEVNALRDNDQSYVDNIFYAGQQNTEIMNDIIRDMQQGHTGYTPQYDNDEYDTYHQ